MSLLNYRKSKSRAVLRGRMLIAWFADATPPVLWRWLASDATNGFGIRQENGRSELIKYEAPAAPVVVAVFSSIERAEHALDRLSRALLKSQSAWIKVLKGVLILFGLIFIILGIRASISGLHNETQGSLPADIAGMPSALAPAQPPPGYPATSAPHPATPPAGTPVDVDSFYH